MVGNSLGFFKSICIKQSSELMLGELPQPGKHLHMLHSRYIHQDQFYRYLLQILRQRGIHRCNCHKQYNLQ